MTKFVQLVNGVPTMVEDSGSTPYNESEYFFTGLAADTPVSLPNSGEFNDPSGKDIIVVVNKRVVEHSRDYEIVGVSAPFTQIKFIYDLPNETVVNYIKGV